MIISVNYPIKVANSIQSQQEAWNMELVPSHHPLASTIGGGGGGGGL